MPIPLVWGVNRTDQFGNNRLARIIAVSPQALSGPVGADKSQRPDAGDGGLCCQVGFVVEMRNHKVAQGCKCIGLGHGQRTAGVLEDLAQFLPVFAAQMQRIPAASDGKQPPGSDGILPAQQDGLGSGYGDRTRRPAARRPIDLQNLPTGCRQQRRSRAATRGSNAFWTSLPDVAQVGQSGLRPSTLSVCYG